MKEIIAEAIAKIDWNKTPYELYEPIAYTLSLGGKRLRPQLVLMGCGLFSEEVEQALPAALGIEVFHNFTLLHDDLMDKADIRRGKPTVYKKWGDNRAILSGDAMVIEAYRFISDVPENCLKQVLDLFSKMALEICEGQQFDMDFETRDDVQIDEYINMIRLKTAVLLGTSLKIGALIGGADKKKADILYEFGIDLGIAFQLQDDLLDVYGDEKTFGKAIGGDILNNKKTFMLLSALNAPWLDVVAQLREWINKKEYNNKEKIEAVTSLYDQLGIRQVCENKINEYSQRALSKLDKIDGNPEIKNQLKTLVEKLQTRAV